MNMGMDMGMDMGMNMGMGMGTVVVLSERAMTARAACASAWTSQHLLAMPGPPLYH